MEINTNGQDEVGNNEDALNCCENSKNDEHDALPKPGSGRTGEIYAQMPVPKYATHYKMDHPKRGLALIFNQEIFDCGSLKPRAGTNEDCRNLKECLVYLGFDVHVFKDLIYTDIEYQIKQVVAMDHSNHDCIFIAILSHGEMGIIYAKDTPYKPDNLWSGFTADKCPTLAGKPKMFFIQACQGDKLDSGVNLRTTETDGDIYNTYKIPVQADFLIVYSTVKGYFSWRNTTKGSWFIQALCDELRHRVGELDFLTILTFVSQRVAIDFESNVPDSVTMHRQKQIPCVMSMLTRLIRFTAGSPNTSR